MTEKEKIVENEKKENIDEIKGILNKIGMLEEQVESLKRILEESKSPERDQVIEEKIEKLEDQIEEMKSFGAIIYE